MGCHRLKPAGAADCRSELLRSEFAFVTGYVCCGRLCYCAVQHKCIHIYRSLRAPIGKVMKDVRPKIW